MAVAMLLFTIFGSAPKLRAQNVPYARTYQKSKSEVEQALKDLQAYAGQKLPIVEGFVAPPEKPLSRYERAFFQFTIELLPGISGGTIVQVTAKVTAWFADPDPAKSGYQVMVSSGRLELDLLDRLDEKFGNKSAAGSARAIANSPIATPKPKLDLGGAGTFSVSGSTAPPQAADELSGLRGTREAEEKRMRALSSELQSLEEIQKNQAHPNNLVIVKKNGTAVSARAAEGAQVLFSAAAHDEFEYLGVDGEWIHVQISGASRGYIKKSALELPESIASRLQNSSQGAAAERAPAFRVLHEENGNFPGAWESLRGKSVKIYTVQPVSPDPKETNSRAKLKFAVTLFQNFTEGAAPAVPAVDGVVVVFDSADGGIVAASLASVRQLRDGSLSEENFWKQSYLDPPEAFLPKR